MGKLREYLIPNRPDDDNEISRKERLKDIKYCLQRRYVYCHQCKRWVTRAKYAKRSIKRVGCHWNKKCLLCQQTTYHRIVDKGRCHVISNGQFIIPNEAIKSPTSSPIPFDMDFNVVPELEVVEWDYATSLRNAIN